MKAYLYLDETFLGELTVEAKRRFDELRRKFDAENKWN